MKKIILLLAMVLISSLAFKAMAQHFVQPTVFFSEKKTSFITMKDGKTEEVKIEKLKFKKGQISELKVKNSGKKKVKVKPADIDYMYLPQSGWDKLNKLDNFLSDATLWVSDSIDNEKIADGYVYFESTDVLFGKKPKKLLMQVLNPIFCSKVKVYNDPFASETASVGVAGIKVAGGDAKSYYFKKENQVAYKLTKKDYLKNFNEIWSDCPALIEKFGKDPKWSELEKHVFEYTKLVK